MCGRAQGVAGVAGEPAVPGISISSASLTENSFSLPEPQPFMVSRATQ